MTKRGASLLAAAVVLATAAQAGAAILVWQHRPQLAAVAAATPALDQAITAVVTAAGAAAAVTVSDLVPATACQDTLLAKGARYTRTANLYTTPGSEDILIGRITTALPNTDNPRRGSSSGGAASSLTADLGGDIHLQVTQIGQGWIAATAQTDCRAAGRPQPASAPPGEATTAITGLLAVLGTTAAAWHTDTVSCPTGLIVTVNALSQPADAANLPTRLAATAPANARAFTSAANRIAWRVASTSVVVAASDDGAHITVQRTTTC